MTSALLVSCGGDYGSGLETELRLGLPGGAPEGDQLGGTAAAKKRGYGETIDLKLKLQTSSSSDEDKASPEEKVKRSPSQKDAADADTRPPAPKCIDSSGRRKR